MQVGPSQRKDLRGALGGSRLFEQPRYAHEVAAWHAALSARSQVLLEIGFDHGRRLHHTALAHPDWQVVGIEVRKRRCEEAQARANDASLDNLLAWRADARTVLATVTPAACLDVVEILFPTPWWDAAKRARRRLVTSETLADVTRALRPQGVLRIATDVAEYAEHIAEVLARAEGLTVDPAAWTARPPIEVYSRREAKCHREGLAVYRFAARRVAAEP